MNAYRAKYRILKKSEKGPLRFCFVLPYKLVFEGWEENMKELLGTVTTKLQAISDDKQDTGMALPGGSPNARRAAHACTRQIVVIHCCMYFVLTDFAGS